MSRFLILSGYFELMMYLQLTGKLNQYINTHYSYLAVLSAVLSLLLALVQLTNWVKQKHYHSHLMTRFSKLASLCLLALPLIVGLAFPTVSLDATIVEAKGFHFPLASEDETSSDGTTIQYLQPNTSLYFTKSAYQDMLATSLKHYQNQAQIHVSADNYMEVMEIIYQFPKEFIGKTLTYSGFVYQDPYKSGLFVFRFGIIHCIADSGVFGLLAINSPQQFDNNQWVTLTGRISEQFYAPLKRTIPMLDVQRITPISQPNNAYVYRVF